MEEQHLLGGLLKEHEEALQDSVGEARADGDIVEQTLDVINNNDAERRLISVLEHLHVR